MMPKMVCLSHFLDETEIGNNSGDVLFIVHVFFFYGKICCVSYIVAKYMARHAMHCMQMFF